MKTYCISFFSVIATTKQWMRKESKVKLPMNSCECWPSKFQKVYSFHTKNGMLLGKSLKCDFKMSAQQIHSPIKNFIMLLYCTWRNKGRKCPVSGCEHPIGTSEVSKPTITQLYCSCKSLKIIKYASYKRYHILSDHFSKIAFSAVKLLWSKSLGIRTSRLLEVTVSRFYLDSKLSSLD